MNEYDSKNRHKYYLKAHLIFDCKYRKSLLVGEVNPETIRKYIENQGLWHSSHKLKINGFSAITYIKLNAYTTIDTS